MWGRGDQIELYFGDKSQRSLGAGDDFAEVEGLCAVSEGLAVEQQIYGIASITAFYLRVGVLPANFLLVLFIRKNIADITVNRSFAVI